MSQNSVTKRVGCSLTSSHLTVVTVSADHYALQSAVRHTLPAAVISQDGKRILDEAALLKVIQTAMRQVGRPQFTDPVYLAVQPAVLETRPEEPLPQTDLRDLPWFSELQRQTGRVNPITQYAEVTKGLAYAAADEALLQDLCRLFYEAGYFVAEIDTVPHAVLRAMAGCGALDALLQKIGVNACWATFGLTGSVGWLALFTGNVCVYMTQFSAPQTQADWPDYVHGLLQTHDLPQPVIWLAWQEHVESAPFDLSQLKLNTPVRKTPLSSRYLQKGKAVSLPALGAAFKADIVFPLAWSLMTGGLKETVFKQYSRPPYHNYQPVLPKWIAMLGATACLVVLIASTLFWGLGLLQHQQNNHRAIQVQQALGQAKTSQAQLNSTFFLIQSTVPKGLQLKVVDVQDNQAVVQGIAQDKTSIHQWLERLQKQKQCPIKLTQHQITAIQPNSGSLATQRFVLHWQFQSAIPKAHPAKGVQR